jgi:hypothetical protein
VVGADIELLGAADLHDMEAFSTPRLKATKLASEDLHDLVALP